MLRSVDKSATDILSKIHEESFPSYWNIESFNAFFAVPGTHALLAENPQPLGMIVYRMQFEQADIITLAVRPEARRKGIARALVEKAIAHMQESGVAHIFLDVEDGNIAAMALYESLGFTHDRRRKLYYRQKDGTYTDALVMVKKLAPG